MSAEASHYDEEALDYDVLNEENSRALNQLLDDMLKKQDAKSVLDMTCGTGSQVFWLKKQGYRVMGSDISKKMLAIAQERAQKENLDIEFIEGDVRSAQIGRFDAVITMFNAVGHLTDADFEEAMRNVHSNLHDGGVYVFDIFNLPYLLHEDNITRLTIDWQKRIRGRTVRKVQYSTIDRCGVLASYTTSITESAGGELSVSESRQTLQVYSIEQLEDMLRRNGFAVVSVCGADGAAFVERETERILMVARKIGGELGAL